MSVQDLPNGRVYTDQTGSFPIVSAQGIKAVMVMYDHDSNAILIEGITSRGKTELLRAYQLLLARLHSAGVRPTIQRMDNEVSNVFKSFLQQQGIQLELTPAHVHRRNAAERAIRTWKNHFLAGLASLNPRFPLRYWSTLLPQSEMTLNLLRQSRINPKLSAYAQLFGQYNYNNTPMAPPGCEIIAFQPPSVRTSWGFHGQKAWCIRPAMNHYRCFTAINESTGRESTVETIQFLPHRFFEMPAQSSYDLATRAAYDLAQALRKPHPAAPYLPAQAQQTQELRQLEAIFAGMLPKSMPTPQQAEPTTPNTQGMPLPRVSPIAITQPEDEAAMALQLISWQQDPHAATTIQHMINAVFDPDSGLNLEYRQLIRHPKYQNKWLRSSSANKFGRLAQGIRDIPGTNTIQFICLEDVPRGRKIFLLPIIGH
jgi:hypothetical protein